jgi:hypothetical protein
LARKERPLKHTKTPKGYAGTLEQLAEEVGDLFYDSLSEFLRLLSEKIRRDAESDQRRGRVKLAGELRACAEQLAQASARIAHAWEICEPYMQPRDDSKQSR